jgi:peptidoglycan hydrolase FlgJ
MTIGTVAPTNYADFSGLEALKGGARADDSKSVREAARQFESLFTRMMLKSMREANLGQGMGDSEQTAFYQDMYDQQLSVQLSKGDGLGLATRLVEQLVKSGVTRGTAVVADPAATTAAPIAMRGTEVTEAQRNQFVEQIRPLAEKAAAQLGVAPESIIAHAALESGWGRHLPADQSGTSFNLFGIKATASWQGQAARATTTEFNGATPQQLPQNFRSYDSLADGVADYSSLLSGNSRYTNALHTGSDVTAFATALKRGGYASDPDYVQKLVATAASVRRYLESPAFKSGNVLPITAGEQSI